MTAMANKVLGPVLVALAIAGAAASCQRSIDGAPCPCLAGYQCCQAEQACYPEEARCPGVLPGTVAWTATGYPTFDQAGNVYVDHQESMESHVISLLDTATGQARWTRRGDVQLRGSTDDTAMIKYWSGGWGDDATGQLLGLSNADGRERWALSGTGATETLSLDGGERFYLFQGSALTLIRSGDQVATSVPTGAPSTLIWLKGVQDNLVLVNWQEVNAQYAVAVLDVPLEGQGSLRWRKSLIGSDVWFQGPGEIFALTADGANRSLVRLSPADGNPVWTTDLGRTAIPAVYTPEPGSPNSSNIASPWPGIVVLRATSELLAVDAETGALLWTLPITESGFDMPYTSIPPSGDLLLRYVYGPGNTRMYKLVGADGALRWTVGPVDGSLYPTGHEYYLIEPGFISQVIPETGDRNWTFIYDAYPYVRFPREVLGYDEKHIYVRYGADAPNPCTASCSGSVVALQRGGGRVAWYSEWVFDESNFWNFGYRFHVAGPRVYVFGLSNADLVTGTLWAFWR